MTEAEAVAVYLNGTSPDYRPATLWTTKYEMFSFDEKNRPIVWNHVEKLKEAIGKKNLLREYPIVVTDDLTVLDGQHRLKAAESLGVPIYYIVSQTATVGDIAATNEAQKSWSLQDYLESYCAQGKPDYLLLRNFWEKYPFFTLETLKQLCCYGDRIQINSEFKLGLYRCNDISFAEKVAKAILDFRNCGIEFYNHRPFTSTVAQLMANADYSHKRMMNKMNYLSRRMVKCPDVSSYIEMINEIYNWNQPKNTKVQLEKLNGNDPRYRVDRKFYKSRDNQ